MITPIENYHELAKAIGLIDVYFKREDLHPYGSHKGRSIPVMIEYYFNKGDRHFAISSSGNAALAAALHVEKLNKEQASVIDLDIFVGNHITSKKMEKLQKFANDHIRILKKERPLQALFQTAQEGIRSLRQSTDDQALVGYQSLAEELAAMKNISAVFIGTSSGTTAQALADYFIKHKLPIQMHVIQTSSCHPIADEFEPFGSSEEKSIADAIVDKTAERKTKLVKLIRETGGYGWVAFNDDISTARELVEKYADLQISTNSALSVVGAMQAAYKGHQINGAVVCIICGD